jgi:uncharacterized membrane protein
VASDRDPSRQPPLAGPAGQAQLQDALQLPSGGEQRRQRVGFSEDFRRFFVRGAAALMPTLITLWLIVGIINFLWENLGRHLIAGIKSVWLGLAESGLVPYQPAGYIGRYWANDLVRTKILGVVLAVVLVYIVGVFVGNFIGRTSWRLAETLLMKVPFVRAIYPAVKQITDFVLADRSGQFAGSRVVAVHARDPNVWSIGLVTGQGVRSLSQSVREEMVTVFVPSSPTAFSGYVVVAPRATVVELPLTVEEAMRLLVSGGVLSAKPENPPVEPAEPRSAGVSAVSGPQTLGS